APLLPLIGRVTPSSGVGLRPGVLLLPLVLAAGLRVLDEELGVLAATLAPAVAALAVELEGLLLVGLLHPQALLEEEAQVGAAGRPVLVAGLLVELGGHGVVLADAAALVVEHAQVGAADGPVGVAGPLVVAGRLLGIGRHAEALLVDVAEVGAALSGGLG